MHSNRHRSNLSDGGSAKLLQKVDKSHHVAVKASVAKLHGDDIMHGATLAKTHRKANRKRLGSCQPPSPNSTRVVLAEFALARKPAKCLAHITEHESSICSNDVPFLTIFVSRCVPRKSASCQARAIHVSSQQDTAVRFESSFLTRFQVFVKASEASQVVNTSIYVIRRKVAACSELLLVLDWDSRYVRARLYR